MGIFSRKKKEDSIEDVLARSEYAHKQLKIIVGKGGVGKTTLAAAYALSSANKGSKTLLACINAPSNFETIFDTPVESTPTLVSPHLDAININPRVVFDDAVKNYYSGRFKKKLAKKIMNFKPLRSMIDDAPAISESLSLYQLYQFFFEGEYDTIVLDAPATGHGAAFLEGPLKLKHMLGGPLRKTTDRLSALLSSKQTTTHIVALAEEMPYNETQELITKLEAIPIGIGSIVINQYKQSIFSTSEHKQHFWDIHANTQLRKQMSARLKKESLGMWEMDNLINCTYHLETMAHENETYAHKFIQNTKHPIITIPLLTTQFHPAYTIQEMLP